MNPSTEQTGPVLLKKQSRRRRLKRITVVTLVFAAGMITGGMLTARLIHKQIHQYRAYPDVLVETIVTRLQSRLDLSTTERAKVGDIVSHRTTRMSEVRDQSMNKLHSEFNEMEQEIASILDIERETAWHQIAASVRTRFLPPQ